VGQGVLHPGRIIAMPLGDAQHIIIWWTCKIVHCQCW